MYEQQLLLEVSQQKAGVGKFCDRFKHPGAGGN